jgi:hypothetical protein
MSIILHSSNLWNTTSDTFRFILFALFDIALDIPPRSQAGLLDKFYLILNFFLAYGDGGFEFETQQAAKVLVVVIISMSTIRFHGDDKDRCARGVVYFPGREGLCLSAIHFDFRIHPQQIRARTIRGWAI